MAFEMLLQEAKGLSEEALMEVVHFVKFIKSESAGQPDAIISETMSQKKKIRNAGKYGGQIVMADDFDEISN